MYGGYNSIQDTIIYLKSTDTYPNLRGNTLWHSFKVNMSRMHLPLKLHMHDSCNDITGQQINNYYHHYALHAGHDLYTGRT